LPYCKSCGEEVPIGASFCRKCGARLDLGAELVLSGWGERFVAWLIDMILLGVVLAWFRLPGFNWMPMMWRGTVPHWVPFVDFGFKNVIYFVYWTFLEGTYGQSVGKMAMKIEIAHLDGGPIDTVKAAIQSVGKAFLLPLDCILGWILYPSRQQRLFNYLSETVVLRKFG
jgi:uncharacterized RDD family membrane protein YckC